MKLELSPEDLVSSEWSVPCPRCRAENLIKAGHYSHKFIVCQGCAHFMGISATGTSVEVSHGGRSPRLMLQSGLLYFIVFHIGFFFGNGPLRRPSLGSYGRRWYIHFMVHYWHPSYGDLCESWQTVGS